jgi:4-amino-4-deoxy-L-arabinose transferase-like glycosyltransferase
MTKERVPGEFRTFHPAVIALVAAAVLLRLSLGFLLPRTIRWDEGLYLLAGVNLLTGNGFTYSAYPEVHFHPLIPIVAGLCYLLTGSFEIASTLVHSVFGGLLVFPVFVIARRVYGVETAWLCGVLIAIFPALTVSVLYWSTLTESLYLFLLYTGLALLLLGLEEDRLGMFSAAGALLGLAYLARPEAVVFLGMFTIVASVWLLKVMKRGISRTSYALLSFVVPFVLLAAPYIWYLHVHTGQWMISGKVGVVWQQATGAMHDWDLMPGGEIAWLSPDRLKADTLQPAGPRFGETFHRIIRNGYQFKERFFTPVNFWWGLIPMIVVAIFKQPWNRQRLQYEAFLATIILTLMVTFLPFFYLDRLFAPALPVLLIWTARGALYLGSWLKETVALCCKTSLSRPYLKFVLEWLPAGIVIGMLIFSLPIVADRWIREMFFDVKEVGRWLQTHTPVHAKVMTKELGINLYASRPWVPLPRTDWARLLQYARDHGADYLVVRVFHNRVEQAWPVLASIVQKGAPEIELVYSFEDAHMSEPVKTYVYRFSKTSNE